ncbi:mucin-2-like [Sorghum bicolor]|uniref:mucin-2-like n=1 Tax=Sorghum bicolor TaxID=4558 RepID=UPI000B423CEB|nr:mucin-2-like [Sorghum bicolor]|eukprot:XP_021305458.1 mucin-2-like [Sorghum bicolor]
MWRSHAPLPQRLYKHHRIHCRVSRLSHRWRGRRDSLGTLAYAPIKKESRAPLLHSQPPPSPSPAEPLAASAPTTTLGAPPSRATTGLTLLLPVEPSPEPRHGATATPHLDRAGVDSKPRGVVRPRQDPTELILYLVVQLNHHDDVVPLFVPILTTANLDAPACLYVEPHHRADRGSELAAITTLSVNCDIARALGRVLAAVTTPAASWQLQHRRRPSHRATATSAATPTELLVTPPASGHELPPRRRAFRTEQEPSTPTTSSASSSALIPAPVATTTPTSAALAAVTPSEPVDALTSSSPSAKPCTASSSSTTPCCPRHQGPPLRPRHQAAPPPVPLADAVHVHVLALPRSPPCMPSCSRAAPPRPVPRRALAKPAPAVGKHWSRCAFAEDVMPSRCLLPPAESQQAEASQEQ